MQVKLQSVHNKKTAIKLILKYENTNRRIDGFLKHLSVLLRKIIQFQHIA